MERVLNQIFISDFSIESAIAHCQNESSQEQQRDIAMLKQSFLLNEDVLIVPRALHRSDRPDGSVSGLKQRFVAIRTSNNEEITEQVFSAWNKSRADIRGFFDSWFNFTVSCTSWDPASPEYGATWQHSNYELFFGSGNPVVNYIPPPADLVKPKPPTLKLDAMLGEKLSWSRPLKLSHSTGKVDQAVQHEILQEFESLIVRTQIRMYAKAALEG